MVKKNKNVKSKKTKRTRKNGNVVTPVPYQPSGIAPATRMQKQPMKLSGKMKSGVHEAVCSITDPFCYKARNSKWPDGQGGGTLAYQVRGHTSITSTASGGLLLYYSGSQPYTILSFASFAAGNFTMNAFYQAPSGINAPLAYWGTVRITSWGIIIRNLPPALTASGYVTISKMSAMPPVSTVEPSGVVSGSEVETHPLFAGQEICVISKPQGTDARKFYAANTTTTNNVGWDVIKVEVTGAPASIATLDIEHVYNIEFTLNETNVGLHQFMKPEAPLQPKLIQASSTLIGKVGSVVQGGVEKAGSSMLAKAGAAVEEVAEDAVSWLSNFMF